LLKSIHSYFNTIGKRGQYTIQEFQQQSPPHDNVAESNLTPNSKDRKNNAIAPRFSRKQLDFRIAKKSVLNSDKLK